MTSASKTGPAAARAPTIVRLVGHWRALFILAWPVMLSRAGALMLALADVVMVGRYDTLALAQLSIGVAFFSPAFVAGIGCLVGIVSVASRAAGAEDPDLPSMALRGLWWAGLVGVVASLPNLVAGPILALVGQEDALVDGGGRVALWLAPGAFFQLLYAGASFYLEGTGRTKPGLVAMAAANVLNVGLNWLLIGGRLGAPEMGAEGAALATTLARAAMAGGLIFWMLRLPEFDRVRNLLLAPWGPGGWAAGAEMRRIGYAGGAAFFFEAVAFGTLAQAAGLLGPQPLAAYTIIQNVEATVFMLALGLAVATAVRVGQAIGSGDRSEARLIGTAGLAAAMILIAVVGVGLVAFARQVANLYTADADLLARAAPLFLVVSAVMVFDAAQVVMGQTNRALGDGWPTTLAFLAAFWGVMIPVGLGLAFWTPLAEAGLFIGTGVGCAAAAALLTARFLWLVRDPR